MTNKELSKIIDRAVEKVEKRFYQRLKDSLDQRFAEQEERFDKKLKKRDAKFEKKLDHYVGAIVEDSKHNVSAVAEQYLGLNAKVDRIESVVNTIFEEVGAMRVEMTESNEKLNNHEERIIVLEAKVR